MLLTCIGHILQPSEKCNSNEVVPSQHRTPFPGTSCRNLNFVSRKSSMRYAQANYFLLLEDLDLCLDAPAKRSDVPERRVDGLEPEDVVLLALEPEVHF